MHKPRDFLKDTAKWKAQAIQSDLQTPELVRWASIPLFSFLSNKDKALIGDRETKSRRMDTERSPGAGQIDACLWAHEWRPADSA